MNKNLKMLLEKIIIFTSLVLILPIGATIANAAVASKYTTYYDRSSDTFKHPKENGALARNEWVYEYLPYSGASEWAYFDNNGDAKLGWFNVNGKWYYSDPEGPEEDDYIYILTNTWVKNNTKYYYLGSDGAMLVNCTTPDGYKVGSDGAWIK